MTEAASVRVAVVTGGRRGIGRGIALALADAGFDIVLIDLERDSAAVATLDAIAAKPGRRAAFLVGDIAEVSTHAALVEAAYAAFGGVHCLVNNAGVQIEKRDVDLLDATVASYDRVMGVNLRGTFFLTQAFARRMVSEQTVPGGRSIVTISSVNVGFASPERPEYCLSKTGLSVMTELFALRLAAHGICTYEVRPGITRTDMTASASARYDKAIANGAVPMGRWGEPEDIGRAVAALASGAMPYSTGAAYAVDGGLHITRL